MENIEETKPMSGGCFVCLDERGWSHNALVYCDGKVCSVAVHQACYGIVSVPKGPWFCKSCEASKNAKNLRCSLCPYQGGALKSTGEGKWAHVICALYIPEVEFENTSTMEPILTDKVPHEKFALKCYLCEEKDQTKHSTYGANITCNKSGCNKSFHVTCGQIKGLLCEIITNSSTNYCGYCEQHITKSKKRPMSDEMCSKLYYPSLVEDHETSSSSVSQQVATPNVVHLIPCKQEDGGAAQNILPEIENMQVDEKDQSVLNPLPPPSVSDIPVPSTSNTDPDQPTTPSKDFKVALSAPSGKVQRKKMISKGSLKKGAEKSKTVKKNAGRGSRLGRGKMKSDNKTAEVEEAPTQKSPTKRGHKVEQKPASEFVLSPKHSYVSLSNFGEESMQASEPTSIGSLRPTPHAQNGQVDIVAAVDGIFKKQQDEYYQFISKGLSKENSDAINQFLELRDGNQKRDALLDQLKERKEQLLALQARLSHRG